MTRNQYSLESKVILEKNASLDQLEELAAEFNRDWFQPFLERQGPFCFWLRGPMGAGKTTLCSHLLHDLGLPSFIPVTSPTYAYMNEYKIGDRTFAHLDLYRLPEASDPEELGLSTDHDFSGIFVEWPEKILDKSLIKPDFILEISRETGLGERQYRLCKPFQEHSRLP